MKPHVQRLGILLIPVLLLACKKEIELDLRNERNKVVIEAIINEGPGPHSVKLTRTVGFSDPNDYPAISNATVTISDDLGGTEQLTEIAPGTYTTALLQGAQSRTYQLSVMVDGAKYTARCAMPMAVPLDTVRVDSFPSFGSYSKIIVPVYTDPAGPANYYHFSVRVNGEKLSGVNVLSDRFTDGNMVQQPLYLSDYEPESGDVVEVTMECIAPEVYDYFFSMGQNVSNAATPADPVSNIEGGALGYFSVRTTSSRTVVVP